MSVARATGRAGDVSTAVEVFCQYWAEVSSLKVSKSSVDLIQTLAKHIFRYRPLWPPTFQVD